jgi:site-specific recombinase XerD
MEPTELIVNYRRFLKRRNDSAHTVKNYMVSLGQFALWLDISIEQVTPRTISAYIDSLMTRGLKPKTINCHLERIRGFYYYLIEEGSFKRPNPVKYSYHLKMPKPLPRNLQEEQIDVLLGTIKNPRDRAIFLLMLRCGLRVSEVATLSLADIDPLRQRLTIHDGKWRKDRIVYISDDAIQALADYLKIRPDTPTQNLFLVQKGTCRGLALSIRGIQKRMEHYAKKTGLNISCHHLRHTMATQMLNAEAELVSIQALLGHSWITTTQRYCRVSNRKVERDYHRAMVKVMKTTTDNDFQT